MELVEMCLRKASLNSGSVRSWRNQRRTLELLPSNLGESLLYRLINKNLLSPPLLEVFQNSIERLNLTGLACVDAEWMAYIGGFRNLRNLKLAECSSITNAAIWYISGLDFMQELRLNGCKKISDEAVLHIYSLRKLECLALSETSIGSKGLDKIHVFTRLTYLDLGGLPVTDEHLCSMLVLDRLVHLELWGTHITNSGAELLPAFTRLEWLHLAWTEVSIVPLLPNVTYLNLCHCTVQSVFEDCGLAAVEELNLSRTSTKYPFRFLGATAVTGLSILELPETDMTDFSFLTGARRLVKLTLTRTKVLDDAMHCLAKSAVALRYLDLSYTNITTAGVKMLSGNVPALDYLSLKGTLVDDKVFKYLDMPSLNHLVLSKTKVKGFYGEPPVVWANLHLQQLLKLRKLDLRHTQFTNKSCKRLNDVVQLTHLLLGADFLTNKALHSLSAHPTLQVLSFQGNLLTDGGLLSFKPPCTLKELDITSCWLLSEESLVQFSRLHQHLILKHGQFEVFPYITRTQAPVVEKKLKLVRKDTRTESSETVNDERKQYTASELLDLRPSSVTAIDLPQDYLELINTETEL